MHKKLFEHLGQIIPLSESLQHVLSQVLVTKEFKKREYLLSEGQVSNYIFFVEKGLVKAFYTGEEGSETCSSFVQENGVVISVRSFFTREPSFETCQALEDTMVHCLHYDELHKIYHSHVEFNVIGRVLAEKHYVLSEERLFLMRKKTPKERFNFLLKYHPEIVQRIPKRDIATYLGISASAISRIGPEKTG